MLELGFKTVEIKNVEEVYPSYLAPEKVPEFLSRQKAAAYIGEIGKDDILITADTIVILDNEIIGKPKDEEDARKMLRKLSGRVHTVVTGVTITTLEKETSFSVETEVTFAPLAESEIDYYVKNFKPLDKAGAYGIQDWIGAVGVASINGSYYNVMGLPVHRLYNELMLFQGLER